MKLYEITSPIKTYIARVKLKNGSIVTATERTESLSYARQIFQYMYGVLNVISVTEIRDQVLDEVNKTLSPQELQVKSLSDKAKQYKEQAKAMKARQQMAKAQQDLMKAQKASSIG